MCIKYIEIINQLILLYQLKVLLFRLLNRMFCLLCFIVLFTKKCDKGNLLICDLFESSVKKHPSKTFVVFQGKKYSFEYINSQANKVANLAQQLGWKRGDLVALLIYNEPAFIWTYLGMYIYMYIYICTNPRSG